MLFLASKTEELFENLDSSEYPSRYRAPFGQLHLWRKQLLNSRQHQKFIDRYSKSGPLGSILGDVFFLPLLCSVVGCDLEATQGGHVKFADRRRKTQFIVPLCPGCNAHRDTFHLKPVTPMLILGSASSKNQKKLDFIETRIRFLNHNLTLNLPTTHFKKT